MNYYPQITQIGDGLHGYSPAITCRCLACKSLHAPMIIDLNRICTDNGAIIVETHGVRLRNNNKRSNGEMPKIRNTAEKNRLINKLL